MVYIIIVLAVATVVLGILAARKSFNHQIMSSLSIGEKESNVIELAKALRNPKIDGSAPQITKYCKQIKRSYNSISNKVLHDEELYQFEQLIYENYHNIMFNFNSRNFKYFAILPHNYGKTRLILLADYIIKVSNGLIENNGLIAIINKFNQYTPLDNDEIFMLKWAIYYSLIVKIAKICKKTYNYQLIKKLAKENKFIKKLQNNDCYLYYRERFGKLKNDKKFIESYSGNLDNIQFLFTENLAKDYDIIKNIIQSLNFIKNEIDDDFLLSVNNTNTLLEHDELYKSMDNASKIEYLQAVEEFGRKHKLEEQFVVRKLFELQEKTKSHFGKYLFQEKSTLKHYLNDDIIVTYKKDTKLKEYAFIAAVWGATILLSIAFTLLFANNLLLMITFLIVLPVALLPIINGILIRILSISKYHKPTPRLNLLKLPEEGKTLVILPVFVADNATAKSAIDAILKLKYSNQGENIGFGLLVDYKKSKTISAIKDFELNKLFFNTLSSHQDINVFIRKRVKLGKFYGSFERKRGAIMDLCEYLTTGNSHNFTQIMREKLEKPKFIVTLDDDNNLLPNTVHNAVCSMLHPLNESYDLMTFKPKYNLFSINTLYSKRYYFDCGYSRYSAGNSFYYNYFGKGIFNGKGIFRLDNFYNKFKDVFPSNRVLSHDIIEGAILNTGELSSFAYENAPNSIPSDLARQSRWFKGDLLLGGFLGKKIKNDNGKITLVKKSPIYNHIILLNIFNGFAKAALLILLLIPMITLSIKSAIPFIICFNIEYFICLLTAVNGTRNNIRFRFVLKNVALIFVDMVLKFFTLPIVAINNLLVALKTLYVAIFSPKNCLNWTTFSISQAKSGLENYSQSVFLQSFVMLMLSLIFFGNIFVLSYSAIFIALAFALYSTGVKMQKQSILPKEKEYLTSVAKRTYKYFSDENESKLIKDNLQVKPNKGSNNITSPTNLGFAILSDICAFELEIIEKNTLQTLLLEKLNNLLKIEKIKGNLYNWYDVKTQKPVSPRFISSVDNGNLLACLIVARQCILQNALYGIDIINKLINEMDIDFLLDKRKNLFHIGYNVQSYTFENHYDLLASEARILYYIYACKHQNSMPWNMLSRDCVGYGGNTLISWSGTMFEYLLPTIFIQAPQHSLLYQTENNVLKLAKASKCQYMWGISESGYYKFDDNLNYQYHAFGLNELSIRNTHNRCVISPYSSALALAIDVKAAIKNLKILEREGLLGEFGFYEAVDMTGKKHIIYQYMSHHQGMIMAAIANTVKNNVISKYFNSDYMIKSGNLLLTEPKVLEKTFKKPKEDFKYTKFVNSAYALSDNNLIGVLANDNLTYFASCYGDNVSEINGLKIEKYYNTFEDFGSKHYVYDIGNDKTLSYHSNFKQNDNYIFNTNCYSIKYTNKLFGLQQEVFIPNCLNGVVRKFSIKCTSNTQYNVRGYADVGIIADHDYIAHPAFKDLFVSSELHGDNTIIFKRKDNKNSYVAYKLIGLKNIVLESNKSNCFDIMTGKIKFNSENFDNSFGDIVYPFYSYNANLETENEKDFVYYQITIYSQDYHELLNKLAQIDDENAVLNLIYSAKLQELSKLNKIFASKTEYEFLCKLVYKLKFGQYELDTLKEKLTEQTKELFEKFSISQANKIIYLESKDIKLAKLLFESLRIVKKLDSSFTVYCNIDNKNIESQLRQSYSDLNIVFGDNSKDNNAIKKVAFLAVNNNIIVTSSATKIKNVANIKSDIIQPPQIKLASKNGGFTDKSYIINASTKRPYSNVICMKHGGFVATNNGEAFTFFGNSRNNKITEWRGEAYLQIKAEQVILSSENTSWAINKYADGGYVECGQGFIKYHIKHNNIQTECCQNMIDNGLAKIYSINILNENDNGKYIKINLALKIALGVNRENKQIMIKTQENVTTITNCANGKQVYIKALNADLYSEKQENSVIYNSCSVFVRQNSSLKLCFVISEDRQTIENCDYNNFYQKIQDSLNYFSSLNKINIQTQNESLNKLFNDCLLYQTISARLNGKCGFYQVGGAIGFRDQLQDCLSYLYSNPQYVREHILECAKRQFVEGDVLHWWHGFAEGVRTRISDDKLFLPYLVAEYLNFTGDFSILQEDISFLAGEKLQDNQADIYTDFKQSGVSGNMYSHCIKALEKRVAIWGTSTSFNWWRRLE